MNFENFENCDIFLQDAHEFADNVSDALSRFAGEAERNQLFRLGLSFRQDELSQRLVGQDDHPSFKIIDAALDLLDN